MARSTDDHASRLSLSQSPLSRLHCKLPEIRGIKSFCGFEATIARRPVLKVMTVRASELVWEAKSVRRPVWKEKNGEQASVESKKGAWVQP
jgi:hypothetical protein